MLSLSVKHEITSTKFLINVLEDCIISNLGSFQFFYLICILSQKNRFLVCRYTENIFLPPSVESFGLDIQK